MAKWSWRSAVSFVLAFLFALELSTRIDQAIAFGVPMLGIYSYDHVLFEHDEYGVRGRPHARYEKWTLNGLGLRGPEAEAKPTPGRLRVVALGASETFGIFESEGNEWPRVLERELVASGHPAEVLNGALAGMTVGAQLRHLRYRLLPLAPDVVVWVVHYPAFAGLDPARIDAVAAEPQLRPESDGWSAMLWPRVVQKAREALLPRLPRPVTEAIETTRTDLQLARLREEMAGDFGSIDQLSPGEIAAFDHFLGTVVAESRAVGARVIVVLPPRRVDDRSLRNQFANFPWVSQRWLDEAFETFPERARSAASPDLLVADLRQVFGDAAAENMTDMVHYNDAGAERIATAILPCVAEGVCPAPRTLGAAALEALPASGAAIGAR